MDFTSASNTTEDRIKWKEIVVKSHVVLKRPRKVMG